MAFVFLIASSIYWAVIKAQFHKDCGRDQQWAWDIVENIPAQKIVTDHELGSYLMFRSGSQPRIPIEMPPELPAHVEPNTLLLLGGARGPYASPSYPLAWKGASPVRRNWTLIAEAPFALKPWRESKLKIYLVNSDGNKKTPLLPPPYAMDKSRHRTSLNAAREIAKLDVGDIASEQKMHYRISSPSWSGNRTFQYPDGASCLDDGKAFRGSEIMTLGALTPHKDIVIIKRLDPAVRNQIVQVSFNGHSIDTWKLSDAGIAGMWHEDIFKIPSKFVTGDNGTLSFAFIESDVDINSFYYWFYQQSTDPKPQ